METDAKYWLEIGRRFGIEVIAPVQIELAGTKALFTALLPQFGAPAGMVVDADWDKIEPHKSSLLTAGYGFSCVSVSRADLNHPEGMASAREMLADWSWSSPTPKPDWLKT